MTRLEVFDPAMCCSTGVCGTDVDPRLPQFAADLEWVARQVVRVARYNLAQEPAAFVANAAVRDYWDDGVRAASLWSSTIRRSSRRAAILRAPSWPP